MIFAMGRTKSILAASLLALAVFLLLSVVLIACKKHDQIVANQYGKLQDLCLCNFSCLCIYFYFKSKQFHFKKKKKKRKSAHNCATINSGRNKRYNRVGLRLASEGTDVHALTFLPMPLGRFEAKVISIRDGCSLKKRSRHQKFSKLQTSKWYYNLLTGQRRLMAASQLERFHGRLSQFN